jgi:hypothetical protein
MSWSENRSSKKSGSAASEPIAPTLGGYDEAPVLTEERVRQLVASVDGLLAALARDEDFHDDLATPSVQKAMKHWTGEHRLSAEEAQGFEDDFQVMAVLRKIAKLQQACRALRMGIPMDHVTYRRTSLAPELVETARTLLTTSLSSSAPARVSPNSVANDSRSASAAPTASQPAAATPGASQVAQSKMQKAQESTRSVANREAVVPAAASSAGSAGSEGLSLASATVPRPQGDVSASPPQTITTDHTADPCSETVAKTVDKEPLLRAEDYWNMVLSFIIGFALAVLGFGVRKYII